MCPAGWWKMENEKDMELVSQIVRIFLLQSILKKKGGKAYDTSHCHNIRNFISNIVADIYIYLGLPCWLGFHSALYLTSHCHKCIVNVVRIFRRCFEEFNSKTVSKFFSFLWVCKLSSTKLIALSGVDQCGWWCVYYECIPE